MVLSDELHGMEHEVVLVDVYGTCDVDRPYPILRRAFGRFDLVAVPVHCGVDFGAVKGPRVTHHALAGALATRYKRDLLFEVTGVRGKTTTATYLSWILEEAGHRPVLSTTNESPVGRPSVTPAHVVEVVRETSGPYVCEVSLGITSAADYAVFTGAPYDYPIAGGSSSALRAKKRTILESGAEVVIEHREAVKLSLIGPEVHRVRVSGGTVRSDDVRVEFEAFGVTFHDRCFGLAAAAALISGLADREDVRAARARGPVPSRLELRGNELIDAHPAVNERTVRYALSVASNLWGKYGAVIGGTLGGYCEGVDPEAVAEALRERIERGELVALKLEGKLGREVERHLENIDLPEPGPDTPTVRIVRKGD
ncbi:hypothetical protein [Methanopyrus sp.]